MKTIFQVLSIALVFIITSCQGGTENSEKEVEVIEQEEGTVHHEKNELVLDGEKRWQANPETTQGINNMIQITDSFTGTPDVATYKTLTTSLEAEFTMIFQKCTMKGEAHNQLHNFLLPLKAKFKTLASEDLEVCNATFADLKNHLAVYKDFFE